MAARGGYQKLYATELYGCPGTRLSRIVLPMRSIDDALRCALLSRRLQWSKKIVIYHPFILQPARADPCVIKGSKPHYL